MPVTGWRFANVFSQVADASRVAWGLPRPATNLTALDTSVVAASLGGPGSTSQVLILTDWGFAAEIPVGAVIDGVEIETYIRTSATARVDQVATCRLTLDGTTLPSTSQADTTSFSNTTPARVHGGAANTFGLSLTRAQVIAATFGIGFDVVRISGTAATSSTQIDMVRMRVHYTEAGGGLTAQGIATGAPTLGSPAVSQTHALTAQGIVTGAPTLGAPALAQTHALVAQGIETGVPVLGSPVSRVLSISDWRTAATVSAIADGGRAAWSNLTPARLAAADSSLATTNIAGPGQQFSQFVVATNFGFDIPVGAQIAGVEIETVVRGISTGRPFRIASLRLTLDGATAIGVSGANTVTLDTGTNTTLTHGGPEALFGLTPSRDDVVATGFGIVFDAENITSAIATRTVNIDHVRVRVYFASGGGVAAQGISTGAPTLGSPTVSQTHVLTAQGIAGGAATLGTPAVSQAHGLTAQGIATGAPTLGTPAVSQVHGLTAQGIATGAPVLGSPAAASAGGLAAHGISTGAPTLGSPAVSQTHVLTAQGVATGAPVLGTPAAASAGGLAAQGISTGAPSLGTPALSQTHALIAQGIATGAPTLGTPGLFGAVLFTPDYLIAARWTGALRVSATWTGPIRIARIP